MKSGEAKVQSPTLSDSVDEAIQRAVAAYDGSVTLGNPFEELLSMGELVDRLSIVNFKLYTLKDQVMQRSNDLDFKAWASVEDVKLVKERARLKRCIDEKLLTIAARVVGGDVTGGFNPEVKKYG
jgi:hypothetical protein